MGGLTVRPRQRADESGVADFLREWHSERVARQGELVQPRDHPALLALRDGVLVGVLTYVPAGGEWEILTLHARERQEGVGSALISSVERLAAEGGCERLWVLTTNDNTDALRFYQRRGFKLASVAPGAVDDARARLKPELPEIGNHGIPIRDEIVLEKRPGPK